MPKKAKVVSVNDDTTYNDITEAVVENESETVENEIETVEESTPEIVNEPEPLKPKARAKRVSKPKVLERTETVDDVEAEPETPPPIVEVKPKAKRAAKVKISEPPLMIEPPVEKPKAVRKPRVSKQTPKAERTQGLQTVVPPFPSRPNRVAAREALYQSLASSALG